MKKMLFKTLLLLCCTGLFARNGNNNFHESFNSVGEWRATGKQAVAGSEFSCGSMMFHRIPKP